MALLRAGYDSSDAARSRASRYRSITGDQLGAACVRLAFDPAAERRVFEPDQLR